LDFFDLADDGMSPADFWRPTTGVSGAPAPCWQSRTTLIGASAARLSASVEF